jgi:hypothetical protein
LYRRWVRLESGPDKGETFSFDYSGVPGSRMPTRGDELFLARSEEAGGGPTYHFADYRRDPGLLILAVIFVVVVIALSRWQGVTSLIGLALSLLVLIRFVLPAILAGESPVLVAIVGAAAVMFVTLYLAHGINARTTTAILGTLASLALTGIVAVMFVSISKLTGFASEEALFLQFSAQQVNLQGLLLGGVIIGTLGVLDDVTVTQASAVWELRIANSQLSGGRALSLCYTHRPRPHRIDRQHPRPRLRRRVVASFNPVLHLGSALDERSQRRDGRIGDCSDSCWQHWARRISANHYCFDRGGRRLGRSTISLTT